MEQPIRQRVVFIVARRQVWRHFQKERVWSGPRRIVGVWDVRWRRWTSVRSGVRRNWERCLVEVEAIDFVHRSDILEEQWMGIRRVDKFDLGAYCPNAILDRSSLCAAGLMGVKRYTR